MVDYVLKEELKPNDHGAQMQGQHACSKPVDVVVGDSRAGAWLDKAGWLGVTGWMFGWMVS